MCCMFFFFFKQKTAYEMRISDWSSDVCSSDLDIDVPPAQLLRGIGFQPRRRRFAADLDARKDHQHQRGEGKDAEREDRKVGDQIGRESCRERGVSVRVDLGGRRIIKKKNKTNAVTKQSLV